MSLFSLSGAGTEHRHLSSGHCPEHQVSSHPAVICFLSIDYRFEFILLHQLSSQALFSCEILDDLSSHGDVLPHTLASAFTAATCSPIPVLHNFLQ